MGAACCWRGPRWWTCGAALATAWEAVAGIGTVVWCAPVSARMTMVTAIATSTPSAAISVPGRVRRRGVAGVMVCGVDMVCSVVVGRWAAGGWMGPASSLEHCGGRCL